MVTAIDPRPGSDQGLKPYRRPSGQGQVAAFQDAKFYGTDAEVPLILDGREQGPVSVKDVVG
jgi:hypothetical protein